MNLTILSGLAGIITLTNDACALVPQSISANSANEEVPYQTIWIRNVFDLKPAGSPAMETPNNTPPPPNIKLTGITTILGNKRALFMVSQPAAPGKTAGPEESYILSEGQRHGVLEVVSINQKTATVRIKNEGVLSTITFLTNDVVGAQNTPITGVPVKSGFHGSPSLPPGFENRYSAVPLQEQTARTYYNPAPSAPLGGYFGGYVTPLPSANPAIPPTIVAQMPSAANNLPQSDVMSQAGAALAAAQAAAASGGHRLMPDPPVNESIPELALAGSSGATGSSSSPGSGNSTTSPTAGQGAPSAPKSLVVPPIPILPAPPTLPASLQP